MPQQIAATNLRDLADKAYKTNDLSLLCDVVGTLECSRINPKDPLVTNSLRMARMLILVRYGRAREPKLAGIYTRKRGAQGT